MLHKEQARGSKASEIFLPTSPYKLVETMKMTKMIKIKCIRQQAYVVMYNISVSEYQKNDNEVIS